jgi:hypothetical protein
LKSGALYKRIADWVDLHPEVRFLVISPEPESQISRWMAANGVGNFIQVRDNFLMRGFRATPAIALVDSSGVITDLAFGLLAHEEEDMLFSRLDRIANEPLNIRRALPNR